MNLSYNEILKALALGTHFYLRSTTEEEYGLFLQRMGIKSTTWTRKESYFA